MRQFKVKKGNYIKSPDSTKNMMNYLVISLLPIIIFAFYIVRLYFCVFA